MPSSTLAPASKPERPGWDACPEAPIEPGRRRNERGIAGGLDGDTTLFAAGVRAVLRELEWARPSAPTGSRRGTAASGFTSVYRATGAPVALKVLHAYLVHHAGILRRFRLEAETIARLAHPQIVKLLDYGSPA